MDTLNSKDKALAAVTEQSDALRAAEFGLVTQVVPDQNLLATATETARTLGVRLCSAGYQATDEARFTRTIGASSET
jgi:enoyl-CoA hydratase/carnithine racemase